MKIWPFDKFVGKKKLEKEQRENSRLRNEIHSLEKEIDTANEVIDEILPRFTHIDIKSDLEFGRYRICVDFERDMVEQAFTQGADDHIIHYFASRLAHEIEYKMIHFNFARCN